MSRLHAYACNFSLFLLLTTGCANPLDFFGVEERVIDTEVRDSEDDKKVGKRPEFDAALTVVESFDGCDFLMNKSQAITRLSLQDLGKKDNDLKGVLFPTRAAAIEALDDRTVIPSMEVVNAALKRFQDGVYAAVELVAEQGSKGARVNKRQVLDDILGELLARYQANPASEPLKSAVLDFAAAGKVAGEAMPSELETATADRVAAFQQDTFLSKPIGYYTWKPELQTIYQRDRLLMHSTPQPAAVSEVVGIFAARPELQDRYAAMLRSFAGLTNPPSAYTPYDVATYEAGNAASASEKTTAFVASRADYGKTCGKDLRWIPPLTSVETRLFDRLACSGMTGTGSLLDLIVEAIQSGRLDLTPDKQSGFFDRQLYALEVLLLPERTSENSHLRLTQAYRQKLAETFRSVITRTSQTSAKQLFVVSPEMFQIKPVNLHPRLPLEPFPTFYLRTARAYAFLKNFLEAVLGPDAMDRTPRVLDNGRPSSASIGSELSTKIRTLYGLHILAAASLGMRSELSQDELSDINTDEAQAEARRWLDSWKKDPDVLSDSRTVSPVSRDNQTVTYSVVAGVKVVRMYATYPKGAEPKLMEFLCPSKGFVPYEPYMLMDEILQITLPVSAPPLTRDELRAIADKTPTLDALRQALKAAP